MLIIIQRFSKTFTTIEPTVHNICEYWFNKDRARIKDIRYDVLALMLNFAGVRPGGQYLVVDEASGLLVSAVLDRLGGMFCPMCHFQPILCVPQIRDVC